jgi:hypothetical protein
MSQLYEVSNFYSRLSSLFTSSQSTDLIEVWLLKFDVLTSTSFIPLPFKDHNTE